jgi:succinyl-CoA synthetase beta subunit
VARLYEYQSKELLRSKGIKVPHGRVASSPDEVYQIAKEIAKPVVLKIQVWTTGRATLGGIKFAEKPEEARELSKELFGMEVKNFKVEKILVEEKLDIEREFFAGLVIDDSRKSPLVIFSSVGGSGIEEIAREHPSRISKHYINLLKGFKTYEARNLIRKTGIKGKLLLKLSSFLVKLYELAVEYDARSIEVNPLVLTSDGEIFAADCHLVVDDYAVFRHPELGIEIAREFDRPATELEKIAYQVEEKDYRGTFYFFQMTESPDPEGNYIGFHGAGGGGSMMSMDAVLNKGFRLANYCDTSGNPPASKVYRAAKIILSQPNIIGYFASGSGVASQEQFHSARGFVKAFIEEKLSIPAVIRLGGNYEEKAIEILNTYLKNIPGKVEGYGRDDSPDFCAERLRKLVEEGERVIHKINPIEEFKEPENAYSFETLTGKVFIEHERCGKCKTKGCVEECIYGVLKLDDGKPVLSMDAEEVRKGRCTECLACEIFCQFHEQKAIYIYLPILGLKEYRENLIKGRE